MIEGCFSVFLHYIETLTGFPVGEQQQCVLQSASDLQPQAWSLQGNSSDFPDKLMVTPPLHNMRHRKREFECRQ